MSTARPAGIDPQAVADRMVCAEIPTLYSLACDDRDESTLRDLFTTDATAHFDEDGDQVGAATIAAWIVAATAHLRWQQHALRVMRTRVSGDRAEAVAYLTSHQVSNDDPTTTLMMNSRYDFEMVRDEGTWRISRLDLRVGTREHRAVTLGREVLA